MDVALPNWMLAGAFALEVDKTRLSILRERAVIIKGLDPETLTEQALLRELDKFDSLPGNSVSPY